MDSGGRDEAASATDGNGPPSRRGRIAGHDLYQFGLTGQPAYVNGIGLPAMNAVLCRSHVHHLALRRLGVGSADEAVLLIGGSASRRALSAWCAVCRRTVTATAVGSAEGET